MQPHNKEHIDYLVGLRGRQKRRLGNDDPIRGMDPAVGDKLRAMMTKRMSDPNRKRAIPDEVSQRLGEGAGDGAEERRRAAANFKANGGTAPKKQSFLEKISHHPRKFFKSWQS